MINMMRSNTDIRPALLLVAVGVALALAPGARGQCRYDVTATFEGPDVWGSPAPISVRGMNQHGHIVGHYNVIFGDEAFLWTPEDGLVTLPRLPGAGTARAYAINDYDEIVGYSEQTNSNRYTACLWKDGEVIDLGYLSDGNDSEARGINNHGQIAGVSNHTTHGPLRAFLWEDGEMTDLSVFFDTENSVANAINDRGQITGWMGSAMHDSSAFVLKDGQVEDLGVLPGGTGAIGLDINSRGWITGWGSIEMPARRDSEVHALLHRGVRMTDLGRLPADERSCGRSINLHGQVVGWSDQLGYDYHAVLWQNGRMSVIDDLLPDGSDLYVYSAYGVNDAGQIAARALDSSSNNVGVLLTPSQAVPGDVDLDCRVNIDDLFAVLGFWGPCDGCPEDLNEDGIVNIKDLLTVIMNWGKGTS